jgi:hypothetical protein
MEMYQSCEEPCFADTAVQKLSQILRRNRHVILDIMSFVGSDKCARLITQFWMRLSRTMSTTEIDGLNRFFIYSELLELAPRILCQDGKFGTTACPFQERFNFPFQIKKPRILMWVPCGGKSGRDSLVGIANRCGLDGPGIESRWGRDFPHPSRPVLRPTQPPVKWVPVLSWG